MSSVSTVEGICNLALDRIGWPRSIGSIYEGTAEARVALRGYGQTRDELLKSQDWEFAERFVTLTATGFSPPPIWSYVYTYPSDCLKVRYVIEGSATATDMDPKSTLFGDINVTSPSSLRVIVANVSPATLCYTGQVTDMTTWDTGFTETLIEELGRRFAEGLGSAENIVVNRAAIAAQSEIGLSRSQTNVPSNMMRMTPQNTSEQR
jgi:hypothetical protein